MTRRRPSSKQSSTLSSFTFSSPSVAKRPVSYRRTLLPCSATRQAIENANRVQKNMGKGNSAKATVAKSTHEKVLQDLDDAKNDNSELENANTELNAELKELKMEVDDLTESITEKDDQIKRLKSENSRLKKQLEEAKRAAKRRSSDRSHLNDEMIMVVSDLTKNLLWRVAKFVQSDAELDIVTQQLLPYISDLETEEQKKQFVQDYGCIVNDTLGAKRSYVQAELKKVVHDYWKHNDHKIPTVKEMEGMWFGNTESKERNDLLLWYVDQYLEKLPGNKEGFPPEFRWYKLLTDTVQVEGLNVPAISVATEAFGLVVYKNCHDKWLEHFQLKQDSPTKPLPADKEGLWTTSKTGKVAYAGWKDGGIEYFEQMKKMLKAFRESDKNNDYMMMNHALDLMKNEHRDLIEAKASNKKKRRGRKRKVSEESAEEKESILTFDNLTAV